MDFRQILVLHDYEGAPIADEFEDYDTSLLRPSLENLMRHHGYGGTMTIEVYVGNGEDRRRISPEMRDKLQELDGIFFYDLEMPNKPQIADDYITARMTELIFSRRPSLLVLAAADGGYIDHLTRFPINNLLRVYLLTPSDLSTADRLLNYQGVVGRSSWLDILSPAEAGDDGTKKCHINIVFIGDLNSGKSTSTGHLIYKLGGIDESVMEIVENEAVERNKSSFKYAWVLDKLNDERERGITIEISLWKFETINYDCTVIDAPGHRDFIKNMITGASMADCAVLIIDATKSCTTAGAISDAQTREHALFAYTVGVKQMICCVNKMDATTPTYSEARYKKIINFVSPYLMSVGYKPNNTQFLPISGFEGENLTERSTNLDWYKGPTLREAIDQIRKPKSPSGKPLRLPLQHVYNIGGIGTVPAGHVVSGILKPGMVVTFAPSGLTAEVKSVESHHQSIVEAFPRDNVGFHVMNGLDLKRGYVASNSQDDPAKEAKYFISQVTIITNPAIVRCGYTPMLCCHTSHVPVRLSKILSKIDRRTGLEIERNPEFLEFGEVGLVMMTPTKPMVVETNSKYPRLLRFALRDKGKTVAVGVIRSVVNTWDPTGA